jgi:hypothetical protein
MSCMWQLMWCSVVPLNLRGLMNELTSSMGNYGFMWNYSIAWIQTYM